MAGPGGMPVGVGGLGPAEAAFAIGGIGGNRGGIGACREFC